MVVVSQVAVFTQAFGIKKPVGVPASRGLLVSALVMVAILAHAVGVVLRLFVRALGDCLAVFLVEFPLSVEFLFAVALAYARVVRLVPGVVGRGGSALTFWCLRRNRRAVLRGAFLLFLEEQALRDRCGSWVLKGGGVEVLRVEGDVLGSFRRAVSQDRRE